MIMPSGLPIAKGIGFGQSRAVLDQPYDLPRFPHDLGMIQ